MRHTIRSDAEILEKFRVSEERWVVLCFHNPSYAIWDMDQDGFCTAGAFSASLQEATEAYEERVCSWLDARSGSEPPSTTSLSQPMSSA